MSDSVQPHRRQPTRLPRPWDSPGKNTGAGCHFLLQCMKVKSESEVTQSCPTLSDPMDCSLPGSSVHGIFQATVLEWGAISFSKSLLILVFLIITILLGVQWYLIVVLICITLMANAVACFKPCSYLGCGISCLNNCLFRSFASLKKLDSLFSESCKHFCIFWIQVPYQMYDVQLSPVGCLFT